MGVAKVIRDFAIRFGVQADVKSVEVFDKRVERAKANLQDLGAFAIKTTAALVGLGVGIVAQTVQTANYADAVERSAKALNLSTDAVQELEFAVNTVDADLDDLADVFGTLTDRADDATSGMESMQEDFALVGLELDDLRGKDPEGLFLAFADAVASTEDPNKRLTASVRILGDDVGRKFLPLLLKGSAGIAQFRQEARDLGVVMDKEAIAAAREGAIQFRILGKVITGLRNQIGLALIPVVTRAALSTVRWVKANREMIRLQIEKAVDRITDAFDTLQAIVSATDRFVRERIGGWDQLFRKIALAIAAAGLLKLFVTLQSVISVLSSGITILATTFGTTFSLMLAIVVGLIAQFVFWGLVVDDLITFFRGGRSVIGSYFDRFGEGNTIMDAHVRLIRSLRPLWDAILGLFVAIKDTKFGQFLAGIAEGIAALIGGFLDLSAIAGTGLFLIIQDTLVTILDLTTQTIGAWTEFLSGDLSFTGGFARSPLGRALGLAPDGSAGTVAGSTTTTSTVTQGATTIMVNGAGDPAEVARRVTEEMASQRRVALDALQAGER